MSAHRPESIHEPRAIIDRRSVADRLAALSGGRKIASEAGRILADALAGGREEVSRRLAVQPGNGRAAALATAFLHDQIVRLAWDLACERIVQQPASGVALVGLGGTGRGEMAPFSDLDLMFLTAKSPNADEEHAAEAT